uniref:Uncharacterized protein n=1 Tax=Romanomermis culicivorax TaxID=13658 RepID=A0A915HEU0_ROMCU
MKNSPTTDIPDNESSILRSALLTISLKELSFEICGTRQPSNDQKFLHPSQCAILPSKKESTTIH